MDGEEDFTVTDAESLFGSWPIWTGLKQNLVWIWPLGIGAEIQLRLRVSSWVDVVEVTELPCRPRLLTTRSQKPLQLFGRQPVSSRVLVGERRVSAFAGLGEDFGERRLAVASVEAVEGRLLPARLRFGPVRIKRRIGLEVALLGHRKDVCFSQVSYCGSRNNTQVPPKRPLFITAPSNK